MPTGDPDPRGFVPADDVIAARPHPAIEKVVALGYRFYSSLTPSKHGAGERELTVEVRLGGDAAGAAHFTDTGRYAYCQNVSTKDAHRRKGIANACYVFAEIMFGRSLSDFWGDHSGQSSEGRALWAQPNRPFGNPPAG